MSVCLLLGGFDYGRASQTSPAPDKSYTFGTIISFGANGDAARFKASGWSNPEKEFTWTEGKGATLSVEVPAAEKGLNLRMKLVGLIQAPELLHQPVEVYVNRQKIADWQVAAPANFMATIPKEIAAAKSLEIELRTPKSTTPKALKMNDDARVLGVGCFEMEIKKE